jgi:hypothetical protein
LNRLDFSELIFSGAEEKSFEAEQAGKSLTGAGRADPAAGVAGDNLRL